jgi:aromatic ring-opening dioxygenase catalytic subunit (LigB family)
MSDRKITSLYISHGGGPLPLLDDPGHTEMVDTLGEITRDIERPDAIIVISAHWEENKPRITAADQPPLIYDYYGFPEESYQIRYPSPGHPALARRVNDALTTAGIDCFLDDRRGFDHGLFVPLKIMYPDADIPCIQVSLDTSLDPAIHIGMGRALSVLHNENLLVLGSGFSFHNMKAFFDTPTAESKTMNETFEEWLMTTCSSTQLDEEERYLRLVDWTKAPHARYCHPREEHLLPLHVCYGVAGTACNKAYTATILNRKSSMYLW